MSENKKQPYGDPITNPYWEAAAQHRLLVQHCPGCGAYQFYPRLFCLACGADKVDWIEAKGEARIYSMTTVRVQISPDFNPPYIAAVVELDEGPRMLASIVGGNPKIGDRVKLAWRERADSPPLPVWTLKEA